MFFYRDFFNTQFSADDKIKTFLQFTITPTDPPHLQKKTKKERKARNLLFVYCTTLLNAQLSN